MSWAAIGLVAGLCLVAWRVSRHRRDAPVWAAVLMIAGLPLGFLLGFAGVGFGRDRPYLWYPIGLTPLLIALLVLWRSRLACALGTLALAGAVVAVALMTWSIDRQVSLVALALVLTQLCQTVAWLVFYETVGTVGRRLVADQRQLAASRREIAALEAVASARRRWTTAGVRASLDLLRQVATGHADPRDPAVRARCDEEERYLRQLTLIGSELVHLSDWFARALAEARSRSVRLTLRSGEVDLADRHLAHQVGGVLVTAIAAVPRGADLTVALFSQQGVPRLHLVGRRGSIDVHRLGAALPDGWALRLDNLRTQVLVVVSPILPSPA